MNRLIKLIPHSATSASFDTIECAKLGIAKTSDPHYVLVSISRWDRGDSVLFDEELAEAFVIMLKRFFGRDDW